MNCPRNELLTRSSFAGNKHRRVGRCNLGYLQQSLSECFRRTDDLLEHRCFVDFLTQRDVLPLDLFFQPFNFFLGPLTILNINTRSIPLNYLSAFVALRDFVVQHPAIFTVSSPEPRFMQERFSTGQRRTPLLQNSFDVVGMNRTRPVPAFYIR